MTTYAFDLRLNEDEWQFVEKILEDVIKSSDGKQIGRARAEYAQMIIDRAYNEGIVEMSSNYPRSKEPDE
jgi:hypothetical protein